MQKFDKILCMEKFVIKKQEMVNKTFRLPVDLVEQLQTIAQNQKISLNSLIKQCCDFAIKHMEC